MGNENSFKYILSNSNKSKSINPSQNCGVIPKTSKIVRLKKIYSNSMQTRDARSESFKLFR